DCSAVSRAPPSSPGPRPPCPTASPAARRAAGPSRRPSRSRSTRRPRSTRRRRSTRPRPRRRPPPRRAPPRRPAWTRASSSSPSSARSATRACSPRRSSRRRRRASSPAERRTGGRRTHHPTPDRAGTPARRKDRHDRRPARDPTDLHASRRPGGRSHHGGAPVPRRSRVPHARPGPALGLPPLTRVDAGTGAVPGTSRSAASPRRRLRREAWGFAVGSLCFLVGALPPYADAVGAVVVGATFVVGAVFFTAAAFAQLSLSGRRPPRAGTHPADRWDWWAAAVQLVGTLCFNVSTT